ncbi:Hypothetical protein LUCI_2750 [Lucifera butyrica]|uniref:YkuS family protein n=1 Tax=Lucifera butyrica TaxID=1351585 RepID=A0A498R7Y2_9FIRM|nr:YkuS family protein [Lucifera butyrica]VBB07501.1 Hypothetical protein LUCI_2750 [Lucifera butyrica]
MLRSVSVETGLDQIKNHLYTCGYDVVDMGECIRPVEAIVYSGPQVPAAQGMVKWTAKNTVMINASGLTPEQVVTQLEEKWS